MGAASVMSASSSASASPIVSGSPPRLSAASTSLMSALRCRMRCRCCDAVLDGLGCSRQGTMPVCNHRAARRGYARGRQFLLSEERLQVDRSRQS